MPQLLCEVPLDDVSVGRLQSLPGVTVHVIEHREGRWDLPEERLRGPEILLCKHPPGNVARMTDLQLVQIASVGYEHLRYLELADKPFRVCNARGLFDTAIAEWNLAMMVNLTRDLRGMIRFQEQGHWERADRFGQEIRGSTIGLWGYGGIGRETARLARTFGMKVHVMTRSGVKPRQDTYALPGTGDPEGVLPDRVFTLGEELAFLANLDFLVLALPRTRQSDGMIGLAQLEALPRTAYVLNPARGPIIQEKALLHALEHNIIAGAALDTHFAYPLPAEHPLWRFPNVILTPHISGADKSRQFPERMTDLAMRNIVRFMENRPLLNEISAREWREL